MRPIEPVIASVLTVALILPSATLAQSRPASQPARTSSSDWDIGPRRFLAPVVSPQGPRRSTTLIIQVDEWTSPEERRVLAKALLDGGSDGLLEALDDVDKGNVTVPRSLGWDLSYAWTVPSEDGGRIIRLLTERPLFLFETINATDSRDYEFGIIELRFDAEGKGEGTLIPSAQITINDDDEVEIESPHQTGPHRLVKVSMTEGKKKKKKK